MRCSHASACRTAVWELKAWSTVGRSDTRLKPIRRLRREYQPRLVESSLKPLKVGILLLLLSLYTPVSKIWHSVMDDRSSTSWAEQISRLKRNLASKSKALNYSLRDDAEDKFSLSDFHIFEWSTKCQPNEDMEKSRTPELILRTDDDHGLKWTTEPKWRDSGNRWVYPSFKLGILFSHSQVSRSAV